MYQIGQRWFSEGEPELGLGIIEEIDVKTITIYYPLGMETRIYNAKTSPLKRFTLETGDELLTIDDEKFIVDEVKTQNDLLFYICAEAVISEMEISSKLDLGGPLQRLMASNFDSNKFFNLRYLSALNLRKYHEFQYKGFLSAKVRLLPHQIYVVNEVLKMDVPKVMLCDEVGLGKTIEASLILNSLIQKELVTSALIIVPESLTNQWFIELYKKFNLSFKMLSEIESLEELQTTSFVIASSKDLMNDEISKNLVSKKKWECLIIDESHQYNFQRKELEIIELLTHLNQGSFCTLFLSATPEVMGVENLFSQLSFLDPVKYHSFEEFKNTLETSKTVSEFISKEDFDKDTKTLSKYFNEKELSHLTSSHEIKQALIDRFGTGRNYFRNSRKNLEKYSKLFNKRVLHASSLSVEGKLNDTSVFKAKLTDLYEKLIKLDKEKVLIICHSKKVVLKLTSALLDLHNFKLANFHSDQSVIERDRQAAYFASDDGAQILISTEIGSEGRNFEFAHHLVLFDLPKLPDQLEQRIGRLDRIGQEQDINIHVPYMKGTFEEILFRWYNEVFNSFESSPHGANEYYQGSHDKLLEIIESPFSKEKLDTFISTHKIQFTKLKESIEQGRDILIEENSYNDDRAKEILKTIESFEKTNSPQDYIETVFETIGIKHEELNDKSFHIAPMDNMLIPSYHGLTPEGMSISYDREYSLKFDNIALCSWENIIVKNAFELLLNSPLGNCSLVKQESLPRDIYFEFIIHLFCSDSFKHKGELYLPFTPLRVLLNSKMEDITKKLPKKHLDSSILEVGEDKLEQMKEIPKDFLQALIKKANLIAEKKKLIYTKKSAENCSHHFDIEIDRLNSLALNQDEKDSQQLKIRTELVKTKRSIENPSLVLDSIRVILPME